MTTGLRDTALNIVNRVRRKLGYNAVTDFSSKNARMLLEMLNEVVSEVSDEGDWPEMYREVFVTASSSVGEYEVRVSGLVQSVYEIGFQNQIAALEPRDIKDLRLWQRLGNTGEPRQFAIVGVNASSGNPLFRVHPIPGSSQAGETFDVAYYQKPEALTTAQGGVTVPFPSELLFKGLYAKALLEENGGERSTEYQTAYTEYIRDRRETLRRFTADTGSDIYIIPRFR
jgi:hypothetical protein